MSFKFISLALTSRLVLDSCPEASSLIYKSNWTLSEVNSWLPPQPNSSLLCMVTHPFCFSCPKPRTQPQFLSFPQFPSKPPIYWRPCLQNIFWMCPLSLPATFTTLHWLPTKLRRKIQNPYLGPGVPTHFTDLIFWHSLPRSLLPPIFSLSSLKPPNCIPTAGPLHLLFFLLGMTHHTAGFCYSARGSNVTSDK